MIVFLLHAGAHAEPLVFPAKPGDADAFYPTAYFDHATSDWNCGGFTYGNHRGTDFGVGGFPGMDLGPVVAAAASGVVIATNDGEVDRCTSGTCPGGAGYGNYVVLEHADGWRTVYGHLAQWSVSVAVGDTVSCGQVLGQVGSSGASTGPHLHLELRDDDAPVDPFAGRCGTRRSRWQSQGIYTGLPGGECGATQACDPVGALSCGQRLASSNDGSGATSTTWRYGCSDWTYSGPERSWTLSTPRAQTVRLALEGLEADLDLYVLDSPGCDGRACVASATEGSLADDALAFEAEADRTYVIVVDGWAGAASDFVLTVACDDGPTPPPTQDTAGSPVDPPRLPARGPDAAGCGCTSGVPAGLWAFPLVAAGLGVRRRRPGRG